ncbi:MAG TPA: cyclopropane fatty acyl phospholipid synthase [Thermoanaerobaculia bacterium]|jgi:cyclopropane-fatty-acyl-phospholipid synthase
MSRQAVADQDRATWSAPDGAAPASPLYKRFESLLAGSGIALDGANPWDLRVRDERFFASVLRRGSLGLGEAYVAGWWDCERLDELFCRALRAGLHQRIPHSAFLTGLLQTALANPGRRSKAFEVGERHYDIGNDLYERMLDRRMIYSCALWHQGAGSLEEAQEAKLDLVCRKVHLRPGMRVLDIGCGWGGLAIFAAERYGVSVVGITVSQQQAELARRRAAGLPIEIRLQDYRDLDERFDAVTSVGMFEHVGFRNYRTFLDVARRSLKPDGLFLLHTIGSATTDAKGDPWLGKYIFPNSHIPSMRQIAAAAEGRLVVEDWQNFGADYDPTVMAWFERFSARWHEIAPRYGERFRRLWTYYLLTCAGGFRSRYNQLWQIVLSPQGRTGGYAPADEQNREDR